MVRTFATTPPPWRTLFILLVIAAMMAGCGSPSQRSSRGGGYYLDDGPGSDIPANIANIPDAVPRIEPHNPANFRPYSVMGQQFRPIGPETPLRQRGVASWYGRKFHGQKTANGETYNMYSMSAAHPTLPLPSYARVTHTASGRSVIVRVNDRGPFLHGRVIDLSYAAAAKLGIIGKGSDTVEVEAITHADIRRGLNMASNSSRPSSQNVAQAPAPKAAPQARPAARATAARPAEVVRIASAPTAPATAPEATSYTSATAAANPSGPAPVPDALSVLGSASPPGSATPVAVAAVPRPTVTDEASDGIYLQFGAFGSYISADQLTNRLNREIAHVESRSVHIDTKNDLHRVRIGPYPDRTTAVNAAVRIQETTGMQPVLAQR